ncbi:MAG: peptide-methionine (R)-S-oxide reductase MsrB [Ekhidna sp.]|nr:peptide-methionine (R)-S-oxide reductase MsrB [Ekhidna sp.]MBC6408992.1 peptide-methionine (R)-S-oxide reductase MsrB [Ekhidna sp.]MBC6425687.1 peptide-methionine (R)-S-oxide reductase MsrB [Ekhidna sp.]
MNNLLTSSFLLISFIAYGQNYHAEISNNFPEDQRIEKSESEWKKELTDVEYYILRKKGTERAFTSDLLGNKATGIYVCAACRLPLFESATKFKSGTGWPSFYQPINQINVAEARDPSYGMVRTEVLCARCDGHLGHVFSDGPDPTGLRYCINGIALDFEKEEK